MTNTKAEQSSQWDGLRHFSQTVPGQSERVFYGGTTADEINDRQNDRIGLQHWAKEGIAGKDIPEMVCPILINFNRTWSLDRLRKLGREERHQVHHIFNPSSALRGHPGDRPGEQHHFQKG